MESREFTSAGLTGGTREERGCGAASCFGVPAFAALRVSVFGADDDCAEFAGTAKVARNVAKTKNFTVFSSLESVEGL